MRLTLRPARLCAVLEAPAVVAGLDDIAVVCQPVEHGRRHFDVAEHLRPVGEGQLPLKLPRQILLVLRTTQTVL